MTTPSLSSTSLKYELLPDGAHLTLRPIGPDDVELERQFITGLSAESRRFRFLETMNEPSADLLNHLTTVDPLREAALGALDPATRQLAGVARYSANPDGTAEFAVAVSDNWKHRGVGTLLTRTLIEAARGHGVRQFYAIESGANEAIRQLACKLGFRHHVDPDDATQVIYTLDLQSST